MKKFVLSNNTTQLLKIGVIAIFAFYVLRMLMAVSFFNFVENFIEEIATGQDKEEQALHQQMEAQVAYVQKNLSDGADEMTQDAKDMHDSLNQFAQEFSDSFKKMQEEHDKHQLDVHQVANELFEDMDKDIKRNEDFIEKEWEKK